MNLTVLKGIKECLTLSGARANRGVKPTKEDLGIIENAAVVFDEKIRWVGQERELPKEFSNEMQIDLKGAVVLPGLIDCHTHIVFAGDRSHEYAMRAERKSYRDIADAGGGILSTVKATREATFDELFSLSRTRVLESMSRGITTLEIKSGYGLTVDDEIKILKVIKKLKEELPLTIIPTFLGAHAIPPEFKNNREKYIQILCENLIPQVAKEKLATFCDIFIEKNYFTPDEGKQILEIAVRHGLKIKIHAEQLSNFGGASLAAKMGAISADHLEHLSDTDLASLKKSGVIGVLLPGAAFFLGTAYPPARKFIDHGLPIALSTDWNPGTCMTGNLMLISTIACSQMKMTVPEVITAITFNAAQALSLTNHGFLEQGTRADLAIFGSPSYECLPYHFSVNQISSVFIAGKMIRRENTWETS
ncbi:MAG: imidazolonepropionase [Deltaproteobacteria bacterium RIFCSPHIGHO2_12_FULL_43_9]|nr:MAG: imidazolonepropionase [Deltaproteobacteria bacterium RIFCSPHIGHO2_12_FULL_43_9]